jgi:hypothetical protein
MLADKVLKKNSWIQYNFNKLPKRENAARARALALAKYGNLTRPRKMVGKGGQQLETGSPSSWMLKHVTNVKKHKAELDIHKMITISTSTKACAQALRSMATYEQRHHHV